MIRVAAKRIAGYNVMPLVDLSGSTLRVFLNVDVGSGRFGPQEPIDADAIDLQVLDADGRRLQPITRPQSGPLPVEGSRGLSATAEFAFRVLSRPTLMRVAIGKDSAEFRV